MPLRLIAVQPTYAPGSPLFASNQEQVGQEAAPPRWLLKIPETPMEPEMATHRIRITSQQERKVFGEGVC